MSAQEDTSTGAGASARQPQHAPHPWAGRSALVIPAVLLALGLFLAYGIADMQIPEDSEEVFGPTAFPTITAVACFVVAALLTVDILRRPQVVEEDDPGAASGRVSNWRATAITIGSFVLFAVLLQPVGWIISAALTFWGVTVGLGSTRYVPNLLVGLALSSVMQLIFGGLLGLNLPPGVMGLF